MKNIFFEVDRLLKSGQHGVIARIIRQEGSAPRTAGTRCLILSDGSIVGTIGGGRMEHLVLKRAEEIFQDPRSAILSLNLYGQDVSATEMLCGGTVEIYLEPVSPKNPETKSLFSQLATIAGTDGRGIMATRISPGISEKDYGCRVLLGEDGSITGSIHGLDHQWMQSLITTETIRLEETSVGFLLIEPVLPEETLYLFGAGHISTSVSVLASHVGFRVVLFDDREDFANRDRFPDADEIRVTNFSEAFGKIAVNARSYIVIVTRGHLHDRGLLRDALKTEPAYIGMIGSRRKRGVIYHSLMEEGISKESLARVHCPIGVEIGAQTPEEIAVSIVAEMISVRNARRKS